VPIYTFEPILSEAGIVLTDADEEESFGTKEEEKKPVSKSKKPNEHLKDVPFEQLKTMLEEALEKEDYERAAKIRDELNKRN
jgi:protein-arginine kinase activator protein McsA